MKTSPPHSSVLIIDGSCSFCRRWSERLRKICGVSVIPYQNRGALLPEISADEFRQAIKFIDVRGRLSSGAEAVFGALGENRIFSWLPYLYRNSSVVRYGAEKIYRLVARFRHKL